MQHIKDFLNKSETSAEDLAVIVIICSVIAGLSILVFMGLGI